MANNKKWGDIFGSKAKDGKDGSSNENLKNENQNDNQIHNDNENNDQSNEKIAQLAKALSEAQEKEKKLLYVLAEKENQINLLRQDMIFEKESYAIKFIKSISKELDDLFRIMNAITEKNPEDPTIYALKVNCDKFIAALEKMNVKVILPKIGDVFDSNLHNAITQIKDEKLESGTIAQVASACYLLGDKVISHAIVIVVDNG
jgi:molecular chaperone GrpE